MSLPPFLPQDIFFWPFPLFKQRGQKKSPRFTRGGEGTIACLSHETENKFLIKLDRILTPFITFSFNFLFRQIMHKFTLNSVMFFSALMEKDSSIPRKKFIRFLSFSLLLKKYSENTFSWKRENERHRMTIETCWKILFCQLKY